MPLHSQYFPEHSKTNQDGVLAIGGDFSCELLDDAYAYGVFPWPVDATNPIVWFSPDPRGIIDFENFHYSSRLKRYLKKNPYEIRLNTNFEEVIYQCAKIKRHGQSSTWITRDLVQGFIDYHYMKKAYCVEAYSGDRLVGGLYGTLSPFYLTAESMFHKMDHASKACLVALISKLRLHGVSWIDIQMITEVTKQFGATYISRNDFLKKIEPKERPIDWNFLFEEKKC